MHAYNAGMQYTLRAIPRDVDRAVRAKARAEGTSLNQTLVEVLRAGLNLAAPLQKKRDLSEFAGSWTQDPAFDEAVAGFRQVDPQDWK